MSGIRALLKDRPVAYYPSLARAVGGIAPALFLQQVAHWQRDEDSWVYRTQEELEEELAMSPKVQATCRKHLVDGGFLEEDRRARNRLHYRPAWQKVEAALQTLPSASPVQSSPKGGSRVARREKLVNESKEESKEPNTPKGVDGEPSPGVFVGYLREELDGADVPLLRNREDRYAGEFNRLIRKGVGADLLYKVCDRIVERWTGGDHRKLTAEQAMEDAVNGRPPAHASAGNPQGAAQGTPDHVVDYVFANTRNDSIRTREPELRRAMARHDFTSSESPPYPVEKMLGGSDNERWSVSESLRSLCRRAVRDAA